MKLQEIQELIRFVAKAGVSEVEIEQKDFKITIKTADAKAKSKAPEIQMVSQMPMAMPGMAPMAQVAPAAPAAVAAPAPAAAPAAEKAPVSEPKSAKLVEVKSPMIGTFYRSSSPDKPAFVNIGDSIKAGQVVCIIEAMKLFNEIESEISGKIVKVLVDDNSPVEYDQPLFLVDPS
jgi:acetyl-CoA carboxylase biotin carboxyl carrier protein